MKKKWIAVIAALVVLGVLGGYFIGQGKSEDSSGQGYKQPEPGEIEVVDEVKDVQLVINKAFFEHDQIARQTWLILETSIRNKGENIVYFHFGRVSQFYVQSVDGGTYATFNAYEGTWAEEKGTVSITGLNIYPGEAKSLTIQFFDVSEDARGLKLFCEISSVDPVKKISVAFEPQRIKNETKPEAEKKEETAPVASLSPGSPGAVAVRFFELIRDEKYEEAEQLIDPDAMWLFLSEGGLKKGMERYLQGRKIEGVEAIGERIENEYAYVSLMVRYSDGSQSEGEVELIKVDGEWMISDG